MDIDLSKKLNLIQGDCLEVLKQLPDKSIDLLLTDPPYCNIMTLDHTGTKHKWDSFSSLETYLQFMGKVSIEAKRVLKENGSLYVFCDDKVGAYVQILFDKQFHLENNIVWVKPNNMTIKGWNTYRCFAPITERILFYSTGLDATGNELVFENFLKPKNPFAIYLTKEFEQAKISNKELSKLFPSKTGGLTGCVSNWVNGDNVITKEQYVKVKNYLNKKGDYEYLRKDYEDLRKDYEDLRRPFTIEKNFTDVWEYPITSTHEKTEHPTQKPLKLIERIVKASSKINDLVLDCFMGSGTTGVASLKFGRRFIGIELNKTYFDIATKRISEWENQSRLTDKVKGVL